MLVEPGESDEITFDFIVPRGLRTAGVILLVKNERATDGSGWYRRVIHDVRTNSDREAHHGR